MSPKTQSGLFVLLILTSLRVRAQLLPEHPILPPRVESLDAQKGCALKTKDMRNRPSFTLCTAFIDFRGPKALNDTPGKPTHIVTQASPNAEVYLDDTFEGKGGAQGRLVIGNARQESSVEARLENLGPTPGQARDNPKDGLKYVWIPPGNFMMGCSPGDNECFDWEKPAHQVTIARGFWMAQTPMTV